MKIILFLFIIIVSGLLSFISSGVEHIVMSGDTNWKHLALGYYFTGYSLFLYLIYKFRFKRIGVLKFYLLRNLNKINKMYRSVDNKIYSSRSQLNSTQERVIDLFNSFLIDKSSLLNASLSTYTRTIQKGSSLIVLRTTEDCTITIIGGGDVNLLFEVYIPSSYSREMIKSFDKEQEKRMSVMEIKKRNQLESIIKQLK